MRLRTGNRPCFLLPGVIGSKVLSSKLSGNFHLFPVLSLPSPIQGDNFPLLWHWLVSKSNIGRFFYSCPYVDTLTLQKLVSSMVADSLDNVMCLLVGKLILKVKLAAFLTCFATLDDVEKNLFEVFWNKTDRFFPESIFC